MDLRSARAAMANFGRHVRIHRVAAGWSQRELARRAHMTQGFISELECGKANPSLETMVLVADALRCPLVELVRTDSGIALAVK